MIRCGQHPGVNLKFIPVSHKPILLAYTLCAVTVAYYVRSLLVLRKLCKSVWGWSACGGFRVSKSAPRVRGVLTVPVCSRAAVGRGEERLCSLCRRAGPG